MTALPNVTHYFVTIVGPHFQWLEFFIKIHRRAGKQCVFSSQWAGKQCVFSSQWAGKQCVFSSQWAGKSCFFLKIWLEFEVYLSGHPEITLYIYQERSSLKQGVIYTLPFPICMPKNMHSFCAFRSGAFCLCA